MPVGGVRKTLLTVDCLDTDEPQAGAAAAGVPELPAELADTSTVVAGSLSKSEVAETDTADTAVPARQATPARASGSDAEASTAPRLMPTPATTNVSETMAPGAAAGAPTDALAVRVAEGWLGATWRVSVGVLVGEAVTGLGLTVAAVDADGVPDAATDGDALGDGDTDSDALLDAVADDDVLDVGAGDAERLAERLRDGLTGDCVGDGVTLRDADMLAPNETLGVTLAGRDADAERLWLTLAVALVEAAGTTRDALADRDTVTLRPAVGDTDDDGDGETSKHCT